MEIDDAYPNNLPKCPVCGHADFETFLAGDGGVAGRSVDHVACAIALSEKISKLQQDFATVVEEAVRLYVAAQHYSETTGSGHIITLPLTDKEKKAIGDTFRTRILNTIITQGT